MGSRLDMRNRPRRRPPLQVLELELAACVAVVAFLFLFPFAFSFSFSFSFYFLDSALLSFSFLVLSLLSAAALVHLFPLSLFAVCASPRAVLYLSVPRSRTPFL